MPHQDLGSHTGNALSSTSGPTPGSPLERLTAPALRSRKPPGSGEEPRPPAIVVVTAYDATFARMFDEAGVDALLVGDSLGMVIQGQEHTLAVTMDEMIYHCRAVARGVRQAHLIGDLPFMSYQISPEEALRNAGRLVAEGGVQAVKLEGGRTVAPAIERIVAAGIPLMGHLGLTPQSVHQMGGYRVQGRSQKAAEALREDARVVEQAGAYALVLEGVPGDLALRITQEISIPTIGIGAGVGCDGQVLVCYDLLGLTPELKPKFVQQYDQMFQRGVEATRRFCEDVRARRFPGPEHTFTAPRGS